MGVVVFIQLPWPRPCVTALHTTNILSPTVELACVHALMQHVSVCIQFSCKLHPSLTLNRKVHLFARMSLRNRQ